MRNNMSQLIIIGKTSAFVGWVPSVKNSEFFTDVKFSRLDVADSVFLRKASAHSCTGLKNSGLFG